MESDSPASGDKTSTATEGGVADAGGRPTSRRLLSLDALRGFDMVWIIGADELVAALAKISGTGVIAFIAAQLTHAEWEGFTFYDLIFPLFIFMVGISIVLSLSKIDRHTGLRAAYLRIFKRFTLLWFWSFIYRGGFSAPLSFAGVLQRIAYCYLVTSILYLHFRLKGLVAVCVGILIGYWALFTFVPAPEVGKPTFEMHVNWANYLDRHYLPGDREKRGWRNEGMLSTLPAVSTCLLGVFAGMALKNETLTPKRRVAWFAGLGVLLVALGFLWGLQFPVIKRIWTSSYVLVAGGYSLILLALFHLVIDIWRWTTWATPFVWLGANALTLYLVAGIIPYDEITERLVGGRIENALGPYGPIAHSVVALGLLFLLARFLYRRGIFLRV